MASRRPNALGEALDQFGDNLLKVAMFNVQTGLDRERIDQEQQRITIAEDNAAEVRRQNAFQRLLSFSPFIEPGTTLAQNTFLHDSVREAWGEEPTNVGEGGIGTIVFNPETIESVIRPMEIDYLNSLPKDRRDAILERGLYRSVLGTPVSGDDIALQGNVTAMRLQAVEEWKADPVALQTIARGTLGLEPITRVELPDGRIIEYDTVASANLSVELFKFMRNLEFQEDMTELTSANKMDLAGELIKQAQDFAGIGISRARAMQIIDAIHSENPDEAIANLRTNSGWSDELDAVVDMYFNGVEIARSAIPLFMRNYPDMNNFLLLGKAMETVYGKEAMSAVLPEYNRLMFERGENLPTPSAGWARWRQSGISGRNAGQRPGPRVENLPADSAGGDAESGRNKLDMMERAVSAYIGGTKSAADIRREFSPTEATTILREAAYRRRQQ